MSFTYVRSRSERLTPSVFVLLMLSLGGIAKTQGVPVPSEPEVIGQARAPSTIRLPTLDGPSSRDAVTDDGLSRLQPGFPRELILPAPSWESKQKANRFIPTAIDPELSLKLVVGRPKILQTGSDPETDLLANGRNRPHGDY